VAVTNWVVAGTDTAYNGRRTGKLASGGRLAIAHLTGTWQGRGERQLLRGSICLTNEVGASVSYTYTANGNHTVYLGARRFRSNTAAGATIAMTMDGTTRQESLAMNGLEDTLVRIKVADAGAGTHTITAAQTGDGVFYFDFFEGRLSSGGAARLRGNPLTTLATD